MSEELREVIAGAQARYWRSTNTKVLEREALCADAILSEIETAGYRIVGSKWLCAGPGYVVIDRERAERIKTLAINTKAYHTGLCPLGEVIAAIKRLQPGDLDELP